jgi:hypothetical protein
MAAGKHEQRPGRFRHVLQVDGDVGREHGVAALDTLETPPHHGRERLWHADMEFYQLEIVAQRFRDDVEQFPFRDRREEALVLEQRALVVLDDAGGPTAARPAAARAPPAVRRPRPGRGDLG